MKIGDYQIRSALRRKLLVRYSRDPETFILDELGLRHGAARIDVVVVNNILHGFELKSDRDTLKRLPRQARIYNCVLDRITLIVGYRHVYDALKIVPEWWGVKLVELGQRGAIKFSEVRRPRNNPSPNILAIAKLLWRDEALALLDEIGAANGIRSKPRAALYARLAEVADLNLLRDRVHRQLRCRTNWRSDKQQMSSDG